MTTLPASTGRAQHDVMGLRVLGIVVVAAPCWIGCGSDAPTAPPTPAPSASAAASTSVAPPIAPVEAPDLAAIRELVHSGRLRAEKELAELLAPPANARPAGPEQLAAVGPCVAPTPEEKAKLGKRVRAWAVAEKNPWIEVAAKDAKVAPLEWGCVEPTGVVVRVMVEWAPRCASHHAVLRVGEEKIEMLAESWTPEISCEREETIASVHEATKAMAATDRAVLNDEAPSSEGPCEPPTTAYASPFQIPAWGACTVPDAAARARVEPALREWLEKESGPLIAKAHPKAQEPRKSMSPGEVVTRYGCDRDGAFFVALDGESDVRLSALFRWDGSKLTPLTATSGSRCVHACIDGVERGLDITLTDLDADGDVEAIVEAPQACAASPAAQNLDDHCTKTEVHWAGPPPQPEPGGGLVREDAKGASVCRVGSVIHVLEDPGDGAKPPRTVVATIGAAGLEPPGATTPYAEHVAKRKARASAAKLLDRPDGVDGERLRAALKLLDVNERDAAVFLASP